MGFQASSIGEAPRIINEMRAWRAPDPGDKRQYFSAIPQTLYLPIECIGDTYVGSFNASGALLREQGVNRIDRAVPILDKMLEEQEASKGTEDEINWAPSKVIHRLRKEINDEGSSSPLQLKIIIVRDIRRINRLGISTKRAGMIILGGGGGGGGVKRHIAIACLMRNGAESAVYINTNPEFDGSDAGAGTDEAVSWGEIKTGASSAKETKACFPMIVAAKFAKPGDGAEQQANGHK
ncbi:DHS-like NAD/FAD-binding domain-containing protein [Aspergillus alliaceus]|uniref:deoxyhypusine synthase n=1 Tax=Petromyces alliaceus TaxID=209559 RepID=A0A5N7CN46_PETAA|nr:DHS-like NAD/FAD-binding domain-containing protein [Aspergillus alliaceus]